MTFSENLVKLQKENGVSNYRLSKAIGVHATTVRNWQDGRKPQLEHAKKVADYFGVSLDFLMDETASKSGHS